MFKKILQIFKVTYAIVASLNICLNVFPRGKTLVNNAIFCKILYFKKNHTTNIKDKEAELLLLFPDCPFTYSSSSIIVIYLSFILHI